MHFELRASTITLLTTAAMLATAAGPAHAQSGPVAVTTPNVISVPGATQVTVDGQTFVNIGLVGMGRIAAGTPDFNHDSLGAFSGMDINLSTWRKTATGYTGGLFGLPDRGPNGIGNVSFSDYAGRLNSYSMAFTPYTGAANLPAATSSQNQLVLTQTGGFFLRDFNGNVTTGFDPGTGAASVITQNGSRCRVSRPARLRARSVSTQKACGSCAIGPSTSRTSTARMSITSTRPAGSRV